MKPALGGRAFENGIRSKYREGPGGIYYTDSSFPVSRLMKPNFLAELSYNGYEWHHQTDRYGFRNERDRDRADLLLLGDSFIYGHGLEQRQTIPYFLEQLSGLSVINMARQGDCALQEVCLLNAYIKKFRPRYVIHFFSQNDISDLAFYLSKQTIQAYLDRPIDDFPCPNLPSETTISEGNPFKKRNEWNPLTQTYLLRVLRGIPKKKLLRQWMGGQILEPLEQFSENMDENSMEWRFTRKALHQMSLISKQQGAEVLLAPILIMTKPPYTLQRTILQKIAKEGEIRLLDTTGISGLTPEYFLKNDGHFSEAGSLAMAKLVAAALNSSRNQHSR